MNLDAHAPLLFAPSSTLDERRAGFIVVHISVAPFIAIVRSIDLQRMAVKVTSPTGGVGYSIVDRDSLCPLDMCRTLAELLSKINESVSSSSLASSSPMD